MAKDIFPEEHKDFELQDLLLLVKASRVISEKSQMDDLTKGLLKIIVEHVGAQRGVLLLEKGGDSFVEAEFEASDEEPRVLGDAPLRHFSGLPLRILEMVLKSGEVLVVDSAVGEDPNRNDKFLRERGIDSVVCLPVARQEKLFAVLYLEYRGSTRAFPLDRTDVLRMVMSQWAALRENEILCMERRQAKEANRAICQFLAGLSHQIRTPLIGVVGMTELLLETPLTREQMDYAETVKNSAEEVVVVLNDLLDVSRIEACRVDPEALPVVRNQSEPNIPGYLDTARSKARILLAEDNPVNQYVTLRVLENLGYGADAVVSGSEALRALETKPYDLVLMDCQMPEMDGYEASRLIRGAGKALNPGVPIIALTANALAGERERCLDSGMNDYLSKPIDGRNLDAMLGKWLSTADVSVPIAVADSPDDGKSNTLDEEDLLDRLMGDSGLAQDFAKEFLKSAPKQLDELRKALSARDILMVWRKTHTIQGMAGNIGAPALRKVAAQAEKAGEAADLSQVEKLFPQLCEQFDLLKDALLRSRVFQEEKE